MTITQTIEVPANRRFTLDIPSEIPEGATARIEVTWPPQEMDATEYLFSTPANRKHLEESFKNIEEGKVISFRNLKDAIKYAKTKSPDLIIKRT